jgi:hypothetical protein
MFFRSDLAKLALSMGMLAAGVLCGCGSDNVKQTLTALASPVISPSGGTYNAALTVTITASAGASIYFTTNGSAPSTSSPLYSSPITVSSTTTVEAIAVESGYQNSSTTSATFTITPVTAAPTFSLASGTYTTAQSVTIVDQTSGATIYYTTDGSSPTASSTMYSGAISVNSSITLKAIAIAAGFANSAVASASYTINLPAAATPVISLPTGTYNAAQTVTITDATPGAVIYYTLNGDIPTTQAAAYAGAISIDATETLKTIAVASGYSESAVPSATYTLDAISLQPGKVIWGADGHRDKGGPYYYIPLVSSSGSESQVSDLQAVFGKTHIFYRAWDVIDSTNCPWCTNDLSSLRAAEVLPLLYVISYPAYDGDCDGITPGFAKFANESAAYTWAYCAAAKVVQANPTNTFWVVGNEWGGAENALIENQINGDDTLASTWRAASSYPLYRGAMAGAIAAIRDNIPTAQIVGGAANGCQLSRVHTTIGFEIALGEDLANYQGRNLLWDFTNLHWGYYADPAQQSLNCGLPSNYLSGKNAYQLLAVIGKPIFFDEIDVSNGDTTTNGSDHTYDAAAGTAMTDMMTDIKTHSPATSAEKGIVAGLFYELYQDQDINQPDELLFHYAGDPATTATIAPQGIAVAQWITTH